ncbi:MAG: ribonuclease J [Parcubacteria group bacterium]
MNKKTNEGAARNHSRSRHQGVPRKKRTQESNGAAVPKIEKNRLRIIPLGGNEEVGRNMTVFEYGEDIIILDMGIMFPEEDMPGIDYIVPNVNYLRGKEKNIRGVLLSHGHLDHIGAAPILLEKLGNPPIIGRDFTLALVKKRMEDFNKGSAANLRTMRINSINDKIRLGNFHISFFDVEHSIMDAVGVVLSTPAGTVIHPGDWTMDHNPDSNQKLTYDYLSKLPSPRILMLESLGAIDVRAAATSEKEMFMNLERIMKESKGQVIIGTFSSQVKRIGKLIEYAESIGKKVALDGYSMKMNIEIAKELGYIKAHKETLITVNDLHKYPKNRTVVICTGAQGEGNAVLSRIITDNHRFIKVQRDDTIIFSSSVIPGNERTVQRLKDNLYRKCDNVIHTDIMDVHISGHCNAFDIKDILRQIKPDFFLPVYANHYMLKEAAKLGMEVGISKNNIFVLDNGSVFETENGRAEVRKEKADTSYVMVDGLGVGDVGQVVLRDRQVLSEDGMFVITILLDSKTKEPVGNIQITSRGFIYVKENFDLVNETKRKILKVIKDTTSKKTSVEKKFIEDNIREVVGQYLFTKTQRRPMVLPVIIEV